MNADLAQSTEGTVLVGAAPFTGIVFFLLFDFGSSFLMLSLAVPAWIVKEVITSLGLGGLMSLCIHGTCQFGTARGVPESRE